MPGHELSEFTPGRDTAGPRHPFNPAGLVFSGVSPSKTTDAPARYVDGVAAKDAGRLVRSWARAGADAGNRTVRTKKAKRMAGTYYSPKVPFPRRERQHRPVQATPDSS